MVRNASGLSTDEDTLLARRLEDAVRDDASIPIQDFNPASAPDWLQAAWDSAKRSGVDRLSSEEIEAEIAAFRKERRELRSSSGTGPVTGQSKEQ